MKRFCLPCVVIVVLLALVSLAEAKQAQYLLSIPDQAICKEEDAEMFLAANRPIKSFAINVAFYDPIGKENIVPKIWLPELPKDWKAEIGINNDTNEISIKAGPIKGKKPLPPGDYSLTLNFGSFIGLLKPKLSGTISGVEAEVEVGTIAILPPPPPGP